MDADTRAQIASKLAAGMLASGQYKLPHDPADAAEFAVRLFRHVRGELVDHSTALRRGESE
jgi:hypothetical protein